MSKTIPKVGPVSYTREWWDRRSSAIGASEAAAICGLSRWQQPLDVYKRKLGQEKQPDITGDMARGHLFEPTVLEWYENKAGGTLYDPPMLIHPEHDFMCATPDALWSGSSLEEIQILEGHDKKWSWNLSYIPVEAKTTGKKEDWGPEGTDDVPQEYIMQAQQQMAVTGSKSCDMPVLFNNFKFRLYVIPRNDDLINMIIECGKEMMDRVKNNDPPEPNWSHPRTYELIRQIHGVTDGNVQLSPETTELWIEAERLSKQAAKLKKDAEKCKAQVLYDMGDNGIGHLSDGRHLIRKKVKREAKEVRAMEYVTLRCKKSL